MTRDLKHLDAEVRALHAAYVRASGLEVELTMQRLMMWEPLWAKGVTPADVVLAIAHVRGKARRQLPARQLTFRTFIGTAEAFEEDLAEARAANRVRRPEPGRAAVLQQSGRPAAAELPPARTAAAILGKLLTGAEIAEGLRKLREDLG